MKKLSLHLTWKLSHISLMLEDPRNLSEPSIDVIRRPTAKKVRFTRDQDERIRDLFEEQHFGWKEVANEIPGKTAKQCRERYQNFLAPTLDRRPWTPLEDAQLIQWHHFYGSNWNSIATYFPGRTNNDVKNRYNGHLRGVEMEAFLAVMALRHPQPSDT
jgi:hypothetical protein